MFRSTDSRFCASASTSPLAVMTAWPLIPRMFLMIHLSGWIESRPVRFSTGYGSSTHLIEQRSLRSMSASMVSLPLEGSSRGSFGGTHSARATPRTVPVGWNSLTTLRTSGGRASSSVLSIGSDSAWNSSWTCGLAPGLSIVPLAVSGLPLTEVFRLTLDPPLLPGQPALDLADRVGELVEGHRDVAAIDPHPEPDRPPLAVPDRVDAHVDPPLGLVFVPELGELRRRPGPEPVVELEVDDIDLHVDRRPLGVAQRERPRGADPRRAVVPLGPVDGHDAVEDGEARGQVVDRERERGAAVPEARTESRRGVVAELGAGRGVVDQLPEPDVDLARGQADPVEVVAVLGRQPRAQALGDLQAGQVPPQLDAAAGGVERPLEAQAVEGVSLGRPLELERSRRGRDDLQRDVAEDRHARLVRDRRRRARRSRSGWRSWGGSRASGRATGRPGAPGGSRSRPGAGRAGASDGSPPPRAARTCP